MSYKAACCALLLVACNSGQAPPAGPDLATAPLSAGISLASSQEELEAGVTTPIFNLYYLRDLWVRVRVPAIGGLAQLKLKFILPSGEVVYEDASAFSPDPTMTTAIMGPMPYPSTVFAAKPVPSGVALDRPIPVAGTVFTRNAKAGTWTVKATVDGVPGELSTPMEVTTTR